MRKYEFSIKLNKALTIDYILDNLKKQKMNKEALIEKTVDYLLELFGKTGAKKIGTDISNAVSNEWLILWNKIKPLFIQEIRDEKLIKLLEEKPTEKRTETQLNSHFFNEIDGKPELETLLKTIIEDFENKIDRKAQHIVNQHHTGSGDNVAGDKIVHNQ